VRPVTSTKLQSGARPGREANGAVPEKVTKAVRSPAPPKQTLVTKGSGSGHVIDRTIRRAHGW